MLRKLVSNDFIKNSLLIFGTTIGEKVFGLLRELIIAYYLGASEVYAQYLFLSIFIDIMIIVGGENVMQVNLVPRFTRIIQKQGYLNTSLIKRKAIKYAAFLFLISFVIILFKIYYSNGSSSLLNLNIILSLTLGVYFFNSIGLITEIAKGNFIQYTKASIAFSIASVVFLVPLVYYFGVLGLAISRLLSIAIQYIWIWKQVDVTPPNAEETLYLNDFTPTTIIASNAYIVILMVCRFIFTLDNNINITHYGYAIFFIGIIVTTIVKSLSIVLLRNMSIALDKSLLLKIIYALIAICSIYMVVVFFFGFDLIQLLFVRGKFTVTDAKITSDLIINLSPFVLIISVLVILNQPLMAYFGDIKRKYCSNSTLAFGITTVGVIFITNFTKIDTLELVLYYSYITSIALLIVAIYFIPKLNESIEK